MNYLTKSFYITMPDGTKKQIKVYGKTKKELDQKYRQKLADYEKGLLTTNGNTPFGKWVEEYLTTYKKSSVREWTYKTTQSMLTNTFGNLYSMKINEIKTVHLQMCLNDKSHNSKSYIDKAAFLIKDIFEKAVINDVIPKNIALGLTKPISTAPLRSRRALTDEEEQLLITCAKKHEKGIVFLVSLYCGLRPAEVRALTWQDIDLRAETISVKTAVQAHTTAIKPPKSSAGIRVIPMPKTLTESLKSLPRHIDTPFVFFGNGNEPMSEQRYNRSWESLLRMMDIEAGAAVYRNRIIESKIDRTITPYYLRHTYATRLAEKNVNIKTAQYLLGHSTINMTAKFYTHVTDKMIEDAKKILNG